MQCVYCKNEASTCDHCVQKALFPKGKRGRLKRLFGVPSCEECNGGLSEDDELFKNTLSLQDGIDEENLSSVINGSLSSIAHDSRKRKEVLGTFGYRRFVTESGIYLGMQPSYQPDVPMMERMARRAVMGLYYKRFDEPVDLEKLTVSSRLLHNNTLLRNHQFLLQIATSNYCNIKGLFHYGFQRPIDETSASVWVLVYYGRTAFVVFVKPRSR